MAHVRIPWVKSNRAFKMRDGSFGIPAGIDLHPAEARHNLCSVHVEAGSLLKKSNGAVMVPPKTKRVARPSQYRRVVRAQGDCLARSSEPLFAVAGRAPPLYPTQHVNDGE